MKIVEKIKKIRSILPKPASRGANVTDLADKIQFTVKGRSNEWVRVRVLDSSRTPQSFFNGDYLQERLEFTIPTGHESLVVDFVKFVEGEYTFEVNTPAGTTLLPYWAA